MHLCQGQRVEALALLQAAVNNGAHVPRLQARTTEVATSRQGIDSMPRSIKALMKQMSPLSSVLVKGEDPLQRLTPSAVRQTMAFVCDRKRVSPDSDALFQTPL